MGPTPADLALARDLHRRGRLTEAVLKAALAEVAPGRPLASVLVARRLLAPGELAPPGPIVDNASRTFDGDAPRPASYHGDDDATRDGSALRPPSYHGDVARTRAADPDRTFSPNMTNMMGASAAPDGRTWQPFEPNGGASAKPATDTLGLAALFDGPSDWKVGGRVGRFQLDKELGRGGMGVVYLGTDVETGRRLAIKTLLPNASEIAAKRFLREGEAQAAVDEHPNVLRVHAAGEAGGRQFLVMDFAPGGDLAGRLKKGPLPPLEAAAIARDLCRGLAHVHSRGVLHRDLKPANVLFDDTGAPRLVDFGLATLEGAERLTKTGALMGTPAYMAPEQTGNDRVGEGADIYGMGAVLYHMLAGRVPFEGEASLAVMAKLLTAKATPPRQLVPEVPESLDRIVMKCLQKKPHQRYASAAALGADLERALAGEAVEAPPTPTAKPLIAAGVLVAAALLAGVWAVVAHAPEAPPPTIAPVAQVDSVVVPEDPPPPDLLISPTFGLPTSPRTYRCQWYASTGSPSLLSFRATLTLEPAVVLADGGVACVGTLSELNVWGGPIMKESLVKIDHDYGDEVNLPLSIAISADGDLQVSCITGAVRAMLQDRLPLDRRESPGENRGAAFPGILVNDYLNDGLLSDMLQLSLPYVARERRDIKPVGLPLAYQRTSGPPLAYTRIREEVEDVTSIDARWVLDADRSLVSCSLLERARALDPRKAQWGETWWGMGPPDEFRKLERQK